MSGAPAVILGCGYTGRRVAERLLARRVPVLCTTRNPSKLEDLARRGAAVLRLEVREAATLAELRRTVPAGARVLHSIPVIDSDCGPLDPTPLLLEALAGRIRRLVYLSTTGVYGEAAAVDETTPPAPAGERERLRVEAERAVASSDWSWLVLRPAAIYGPGRGVHESMRLGRYRLAGRGDNLVSRIHVEDLAAVAEAALDSELTGAYPVADLEPCTAREMAEFCAQLLGLPPPGSVDPAGAHRSRQVSRRVDGSAILRRLGLTLRYPSYRIGVPAALAASGFGGEAG
jgi:nucleoside-diphosphate-sugar epimerase